MVISPTSLGTPVLGPRQVEFAAYCTDQGVGQHHTAQYSPQQNGMVERQNQTVVGMARSMMKAKGMPVRFWGEVRQR